MPYHLAANGVQKESVSEETLRAMIAEGVISADTLCKRDGWTDWRPVAQVFPERFTQVRQTPLHSEAAAPKFAASLPAKEPEPGLDAVYYHEAAAASHPHRYKPTGITWVLLGLLVTLVILAVSAVLIGNR
jgi:hypothetical protein